MHRTHDDGAPPLADLDDAFLRLRRLWSARRQGLVAPLGSVAEPYDMSSLLVLEACARGEADGRDVSVGDVAALADVTPSTASRVVERALAAGLIAKSTAGRRTVLVLTDDGRHLQERSAAARLAWLQERFRAWQPADVDTFARLLVRFADGLEGDRSAAASAGRPS